MNKVQEHQSAAADDPVAGNDRSVSQTLSRGVQVLEILAEAGRPMSAQQIAAPLGLKRPIVYRLLKTLERHQLVRATSAGGQFELGVGLLSLTRNVKRDLRQAAYPVIRNLAEQVGTTAVLGMVDGDEIVYVLTVEAESARMAVRSREGYRRPMNSTSGLAVQMSQAPSADDCEELLTARQNGYAARDSVMGFQATAISAPVPISQGTSRLCVTVLFPRVIEDVIPYGTAVKAAAEKLKDYTHL